MLPHLFPHLQHITPPRKPKAVRGLKAFGSFRKDGGQSRGLEEPSDKVRGLMEKHGLVDQSGQPTYVWPPSDGQAIRDSMDFQLNRAARPTQAYHQDTVDVLAGGFPYPLEVGDETVVEWLRGAAERLEPMKGTAYAAVYGAKLKRDFVSRPENLVRSLGVVAWLALVNEDWLASLTPQQLYEAGVLEAEGLFVKPEMHPRKKANQKRWRIIWNCSAQHELTMRLMHDAQNKIEIAAYQAGLAHSEECPKFGSCPGMGHHDQGIVDMCEAMGRLRKASDKGNGVETCQADASGWDYTVTRRLWLADAYRRAHLLGFRGLGV